MLAPLLLVSLLFAGCGGASDTPDGGNSRHTAEVVQAYMTRFPQSQLRDLYKFCFQGVFGLEHLMRDSLGAASYIERELASADSADWQRPLFHYPVGIDGDFVRVDLNYVRQGVIPASTLVSAMLHSGKAVDDRLFEEWKKQWADIMESIVNVQPRPLNIEEDARLIDSLLAEGQYAWHHSKLFNETYRQHYRIIRRDVFEQELLPLIERAEAAADRDNANLQQ